jgi:hypothetical protein
MRISHAVPLRRAEQDTIGKFASRDYTGFVEEREALVQALRVALVGVLAVSTAGLPAYACPAASRVQTIRSYVPSDAAGGETIKKVNRGDRLAVACDGIDFSSAGDLRVVLSVDATGAKKLGYQGVLATDQTRTDGKLQIVVPDAPNLANQTVDLKVFLMNGDSAKTCDAGRVRVV